MLAVKLWSALPVLEELSRVSFGYETAKQVMTWVKLARTEKEKAQAAFDELAKRYEAEDLGEGRLRFTSEENRRAFAADWDPVENKTVTELPEKIDLRSELKGMRISAAALEALEEMIITEGAGDGTAEDEV